MTIALDLMGGDFAPEAAIDGVRDALADAENKDASLLLLGTADAIRMARERLREQPSVYYLESGSVIGMDEHPTKALREKPDSSIALGFGALKTGKADAFISAGNTGAMMVGAMYSVGTVPGVLRPAIASPIPREDGGFGILLDVGANADCKPENLVQFAALGALYAQHVLGVAAPAVGLMNLGEEEGKGNLLAQAVYPLLKESAGFRFVGNLEGRDLFSGKADVVVCEGFVGNVVLKLAESIHHIFARKRGVHDDFLEHFNYETYGGTPILGVNAPVIIGHGISPALAFRNMIGVGRRIAAARVVDIFQKHFGAATA